MQQRQGFPNLSIQLYLDYNAVLENKFTELSPALISMTMRDGLSSGLNEGLIQIYDDKTLHEKMTGDEFIRVVVGNANTSTKLERIYGIHHYSVTINNKNDNILTIQVGTLHHIDSMKFCKSLSNNAADSLTSMIETFYRDKKLLKPDINSINVRVPQTQWAGDIQTYKKFISLHGASVNAESFPLVYECINGIVITDNTAMMNKVSKEFVIVDPDIIGEFGNYGTLPIAFDFKWLTKSNPHKRNRNENITYYSHSFIDNTLRYNIVGAGFNTTLVERSGAYSQKIDKDGVEELTRDEVLTQSDSYAKVTVYGDFSIMPTDKIRFYDYKHQAYKDFHVDEVVHEMSREQSVTNIYMFNRTKDEK